MQFSPGRVTKQKTIYQDHYPLIVTFENIPTKNVKTSKPKVVFNTNKVGGWENYNKTTENSKELDSIFLSDFKDITKEVKKLENIHDNIKENVFGRVKYKKNNIMELTKLQNEKISLMTNNEDNDKINHIDEKIREALLDSQRETFEKELDDFNVW